MSVPLTLTSVLSAVQTPLAPIPAAVTLAILLPLTAGRAMVSVCVCGGGYGYGCVCVYLLNTA